MFEPNLNLPPIPAAMPAPAPIPDAVQTPVIPQGVDEPPAPPQFIPVPIVVQPPKPKPKEWAPDIVRKAQGIYPAEAQAKASMVAQAKMPTPSGAWGASQ